MSRHDQDQAPEPEPAAPSGYAAFAERLEPLLAHGLEALNLDVVYRRASGDYLYTDPRAGQSLRVLDLLGGYGVSLLGHNPPELVERMRRSLDEQLPFCAQASVRTSAGLVAERLSALVTQLTGDEYVATLSSTGTEAIECAIKHAELEFMVRRETQRERLRRDCVRARAQLPDARPELAEQLDALEREANAVLARPPVFMAVEGAFHGKSTGSLNLTHYPAYREPWGRLGWETLFIPRDQPQAVNALLRERCSELPTFELVDGALVVERAPVCDVVACFAEPVQGEGGVHELSVELLGELRRAADAHGYPLVFDEIQSGLGRCGSLLASAITGVHADYYVFGKALGGGLTKISATLIDAARYVPDFGQLHTSTFAEDELSSEVALGVLDILTRDGGEVIETCAHKGDYLLAKLTQLQRRFPAQLAAVRGRGLLIGVELSSCLDADSPLLRLLSEQRLLGYAVCAYLLREHQIRCAPTLSSPTTLRVEPSVQISEAELDRFCAALEQLLGLIAERRLEQLVRPILARPKRPPTSKPVARLLQPARASVSSTPNRVGFLVHFPEATDLRAWDPSIAGLDVAECERFIAQTRGLLEPFIVSRGEIVSRVGPRVEVVIIGVPFTTAQAMTSMRAGDNWALNLVRRGVALARDEGCCVVGLGGHTSIVSRNCTLIDEPGVALTSGNSLAVYAAVEALEHISARRGLSSATTVGVVGAAGNIGSVVAEIMADRAERLILVGHRGMHRFLEPVADSLYARALDRLRRREQPTGVAAKISTTAAALNWLERSADPSARQLNGFRDALHSELDGHAPIAVSTSLDVLRGCPKILTASNSARPLIDAAHLGEGPIVICDIAVPQDVSAEVVDSRRDVNVVRGGVLEAPSGSNIRLIGADLGDGELYACLAETILLALEHVEQGGPGDYSVGKLTRERVMEIGSLAARHGFEIREKPL